MEPWERDIVFALDCEMIQCFVSGKRINMAARIVLVKNNPKFISYGWSKVLDTYIYHPKEIVRNYMTRYSGIEPWMVKEGAPMDAVVTFLLRAIAGHTVVTFNGKSDFLSLGITSETVLMYASRHVELQNYFQRPDGTPYGLGPLVDYFGYRRNGRPVIIRHNCVDDALFTLRLYVDHFRDGEVFAPLYPVLSKSEYYTKYSLY